MTQAPTEKPYRFAFDNQRDTWVCSVHGDVESAWIRCWNGCQDGQFDAYEEDPMLFDEGDMETCAECHGNGGFTVCAECNADNPDAEF